jgi:hypothetical protein
LNRGVIGIFFVGFAVVKENPVRTYGYIPTGVIVVRDAEVKWFAQCYLDPYPTLPAGRLHKRDVVDQHGDYISAGRWMGHVACAYGLRLA